jgi:DNA topoisomerase IB
VRVKLNTPVSSKATGKTNVADVVAEKPKLKSAGPVGAKKTQAPIDERDAKDGTAKAGDAPREGTISGGRAGKSAVHARMLQSDDDSGAIKNAKKTAETHPESFWNGKEKWKTPPPKVDVIVNPDNTDGRGWIEKWRAPGKGGVPDPNGKWVHNYTLEEMQRKAGEKFVKNRGFAQNLGELRMQMARDLRGSVEDKSTRVALAVAVIDRTYIRVGNETSTKRAASDDDKVNTYGITTMLGQHLSIADGKATFTFVGKSEVAHTKVVEEPRLVKMLGELKARTKNEGELFAGVSASDVNTWLEPFGGTAKSFRTYHATRMATDAFRAWDATHKGASKQERENIVQAVVAEVAERLGHTPQVCQGSYIDPAIVTLFVKGKMP